MPVFQPANQIKLTNVSIVRLRKGGKRFEIACYKNKVREWRTGVETDLDEVVQIENVFLNVSKGQVAPSDDLQKAFGTTDTAKILQEILKKGELQVGEKERQHELANTWRDIATQVAEKCVDPGSQRPYTVGMIEKAMHDVHYSVKTGRSAKQQALDVIRLLQEKKTMPIERARMRIRITMPAKDGKKLKPKIVALTHAIDDEDWAEDWELVAFIDPGALKAINELVEAEIKGRANVETLNFTTIREGDGDERLE
ncbi:shwachman-Bodian-diamond syndrome protein [Moesziomyces antarcticus]|uniref:Ribosome maturation protein SDO1 n=2 Tax=Pseudozyma antarctica TaxID=84753 RepID=A0A081CKH7_PSEA2|nr:shwachman-Bodian-diamond syndrome protein [Moesziomyces antarcticus]GAK67173.1 shwachman-Bodian-diamond syndrome protein [Moesziomyces antarcticus]SPO48221.1 probable Shwachman-Bodian-Diamond syndrome protein [Moesziomyces antarcticus]